jgi:protein-arginine kinase activator protein McsA
MEPLAIIALVGNVVQFVEFSGRLIAKSTELYRSSEGALAENIDAETAASHLVLISDNIQTTASSFSDEALKRLCESCKSTADELIAALNKVKVNGKQNRWKSMRRALRSVWSKEKIHELDGRLSRFKEELNLHILVDLRYVDIFLHSQCANM